MPARRDVRPYIYLVLDQLFVIAYVIALVEVMPNRLPSATVHLWAIPVGLQLMSAGMATIFWKEARPVGRVIALVGGSLVLLLTVLLIARVIVSAAFLAGVYGAFGQAAATFAIVAVALVIEVVALLPIVQVKYLRSRAGRQAYS